MRNSGSDDEGTFCAIAGCTDHAMTQRWIMMGDGSRQHIEVCWKHAAGDIDPARVEEGLVPPTSS
jgi:hypothetical protein